MVAIGNAPTALFHLLEMIAEGAPKPALVLGFPVGFVGAAEAKAALAAFGRGLEFIALHGRRGGSALAAAAVNALAGPTMTPWLAIVGIGEDGLAGLSAAARTLGRDRRSAGRRRAPSGDGAATGPSAIVWSSPLADTIAAIAARRGRRVAVLASGDPMWYGVGRDAGAPFSRATKCRSCRIRARSASPPRGSAGRSPTAP